MSSHKQRIAFIGLGAMGFPMAGHLQRAGFETCVYNRTTEKAKRWVERYGGSMALTPRDAAKNAEFVCLCVGNDNDIRNVVYGDTGVLAGMASDTVLIDHTTASAELARELATSASARNISFLDAPVSGGQAGAENGALTIMTGGSQATFDRAMVIFNCYAKMPVSWVRWARAN